mmetsp:Transcript_41527/g.81643  ORF Transcript_41527/g.81643 Transcript_41527/m.81643 type:complete len:156 (-) Transcript_41527:87-554(-)
MVGFALTINGLAMVPLLQAPLPMVSGYFQLSCTTSDASTTGALFDKAEKVRVEDALSAVMSSTLNLGCILGPIIGGVGLELLPHTRDPGCREDPVHTGRHQCESAFGWATTVLSFLFVLLAAAVASLPSLQMSTSDTMRHSKQKGKQKEETPRNS